MPVSSSTSRVSPSTIDSPSCTSMTPPGGDQSSDPFRRRFSTSSRPSGPSTMPPATNQSRIRRLSDLAVVPCPVRRSQLPLEELAGTRAGQLVHEADRAGDLVPRQVLAGVRDHVLLG